jgi:hypothetical protein
MASAAAAIWLRLNRGFLVPGSGRVQIGWLAVADTRIA